MKRRDFVAFALAGAAGAALAQRVYRIAVLMQGTERSQGARLAALRAALKAHGYVEGRNLQLAAHWNEGALERLPDLAAELLRGRPDVVVASPVLSAAAIQQHSRTAPVVLAYGAGLVKIGLAKTLARPGANVTGLETQNEELIQKHVELLKAVAPRVSRLAVLNTGRFLFHEEAWRATAEAAKALKLALVDVRVDAPAEVARLASRCAAGGCDGLYVMPDPVLINWRAPILEQAARLRLPGMYFQPEFVREGGLVSYSANIEEMFGRAAGYVDRILRGARPEEMPIERPLKFDVTLNLKTARALGLTIPDALLARADQVIQ